MIRAGIFCLAFLGLAACGELQPVVQDPEAAAEAGQMSPGLYGVGDGTQIYSRTRLSEDGTYTDFNDAMEPVGSGTWEARDGLLCFDPEGDGEDKQERCWANGPADADGSFRTVRVDTGENYRVTPLDE